MKMIDYVQDNVPAYALSYLVNGDASGMEDEDQANADAWMEYCQNKMAKDYPGLACNLIVSDAEPSFVHHPAFGLACEAVWACFVVWADNDHPLQAIALPWEDEENKD